MSAEIKINTALLETLKSGRLRVYFRYDTSFDAVVIQFVPPETETVVEYIDEHLGILLLPESNDFVGIQIENFKHSFLSKHNGIKKAWEFKSKEQIQSVDQLCVMFEEVKPRITREIFKVSANALSRHGLPAGSLTEALFENACQS